MPKDKRMSSSSNVAAAEQWLKIRLEPSGVATKYIAGFRGRSGRELALDRVRQSIYVWISRGPPPFNGVTVTNRTVPGQPYAPDQSRHSNLRSQAPSLAEGFTAYYLRIEDLPTLKAVVDWYEG